MTKDEIIEDIGADAQIPVQDLAFIGLNEIAYVREVNPVLAGRMFPEMPELPSDVTLYAAFGADGTPLFISGSMPALVAETMVRDLTLVPLH